MIPKFPQFAPVPLSGRSAIAELTGGIGCTSDFSHPNLWAWAIARRLRVSQLNGNLVLRYENGITNEFAYTFAGIHDARRTAETLLSAAHGEGWTAILNLVPEETARAIGCEQYSISEDRDYFDYLYDVESLANLCGNRHRSQRRTVNQFQKAFSTRVEKLDLGREETKREIIDLVSRWRMNKIDDGKPIKPSLWGTDDLSPMLRLLDCAAHFPLLGMGVRVEGELAGCFLTELCDGYAVAHFGKADSKRFKGAGAVAVTALARMLLTQGYTVLNYQEDMGLPSLRAHKLRLRPSGFVKKYSVRLHVPVKKTPMLIASGC